MAKRKPPSQRPERKLDDVAKAIAQNRERETVEGEGKTTSGLGPGSSLREAGGMAATRDGRPRRLRPTRPGRCCRAPTFLAPRRRQISTFVVAAGTSSMSSVLVECRRATRSSIAARPRPCSAKPTADRLVRGDGRSRSFHRSRRIRGGSAPGRPRRSLPPASPGRAEEGLDLGEGDRHRPPDADGIPCIRR